MSPGSHVGIAGIGRYLPERWLDAEAVADLTGMSARTVRDKFGMRGKHVAADDEHVSAMAAKAGAAALQEAGTPPEDIGAVVYFGSTWKDYAVWQAAPKIAHDLECSRAFALELDYVSCGGPVALRVCRDMLIAEPDLRAILVVAASRESHLLDYRDRWSQFMFTFGDGAVAAVLVASDAPPSVEVLGSHMITDGSFANDAMVPAGGSVEPASHLTVDAGRHRLKVENPGSMAGLLMVTLSRLTTAGLS